MRARNGLHPPVGRLRRSFSTVLRPPDAVNRGANGRFVGREAPAAFFVLRYATMDKRAGLWYNTTNL